MPDARNSTTTRATSSPSALSTESIIGIVFGICASLASFVTIWQAHKAWRGRQKQLNSSHIKIDGKYETSEASSLTNYDRPGNMAESACCASDITDLPITPEACIIVHQAKVRMLEIPSANHVLPAAAASSIRKHDITRDAIDFNLSLYGSPIQR